MFKKIISLLLAFTLLFSPLAFAKDLYINSKPPLGSQIDWSNPLSRGLVGAWLMNEGAGNISNSIAQCLPALFKNGAYFINTPKGKGIYFDGVNDYVLLPNKFLKSPSNFSIVVAFSPVSNQGEGEGYTILVDLRNDWQIYTGWIDSNDATHPASIRVDISDGTQRTIWSANNSVAIGSYHQFVFTYTNKLLSLYLDANSPLTTPSAGDAIAVSAGYNTIGSSYAPGRYSNAKIIFVYIYSRALSPFEAQSLYIDPYQIIKQNYRLYVPAVAPPTAVFGGRIIQIQQSW